MPVEKRKVWALVMNSARARIVRSLGWVREPGDDTTPPEEIEFGFEPKTLSDVMSDKPGRSFASAGGGRRSAMEYGSDPVAEETRGMIREVVTALEHHHARGDFRELAIYAEAQVLGELRKMLPGTLRQAVSREETANYLKLDARDLHKTLSTDLGIAGGVR